MLDTWVFRLSLFFYVHIWYNSPALLLFTYAIFSFLFFFFFLFSDDLYYTHAEYIIITMTSRECNLLYIHRYMRMYARAKDDNFCKRLFIIAVVRYFFLNIFFFFAFRRDCGWISRVNLPSTYSRGRTVFRPR